MAENLLDRPEVGSSLEEMGGGRVPKSVRGDVWNARARRESMDDLADLPLINARPPEADK